MATKTKATSAKSRGGDTSRTSSQGRKVASGGNINQKGDDEIDESSKAPVKAVNKQKKQARGK